MMIDFKATKRNLLAHADALEEHAESSLTAWILLGKAQKYQRIMGAVWMLRRAADISRIEERREYLRDIDAGF